MENKYQEKFGYPVQRTAGKVKSQMARWIQDVIRHSPFVFLRNCLDSALTCGMVLAVPEATELCRM